MALIQKDIKMHALNPPVFSSKLSIYLESKPKLLKWHFCVHLDLKGRMQEWEGAEQA